MKLKFAGGRFAVSGNEKGEMKIIVKGAGGDLKFFGIVVAGAANEGGFLLRPDGSITPFAANKASVLGFFYESSVTGGVIDSKLEMGVKFSAGLVSIKYTFDVVKAMERFKALDPKVGTGSDAPIVLV